MSFVITLQHDPAFQMHIPTDNATLETIRDMFDIYLSNMVSFFSAPRTPHDRHTFDIFINKLRNYLNVLCTPVTGFSSYPPELQTSITSPRTVLDNDALRQQRLNASRLEICALKVDPVQVIPVPVQVVPVLEAKFGGTLPIFAWNPRTICIRAEKLGITTDKILEDLKLDPEDLQELKDKVAAWKAKNS